MPSRIIRDGILTSSRIDSLSESAELFYRRLMSVVDDFGRYHAVPVLLRAACYPLRIDRVSDDDVRRYLSECQEAGLLTVYGDGHKAVLELSDFRQRTRASRSRFDPLPDGCQTNDRHMTGRCQTTARLDGDEDGDVFGDGDEYEKDNTTTSTTVLQSERDPDAGSVSSSDLTPGSAAKALRDLGVSAQSQDPTLRQWVADGIGIERLQEAVEIARASKPRPQKIPTRYLDAILRAPPRASTRATGPPVSRRQSRAAAAADMAGQRRPQQPDPPEVIDVDARRIA